VGAATKPVISVTALSQGENARFLEYPVEWFFSPFLTGSSFAFLGGASSKE
jgi:hypothetical protein